MSNAWLAAATTPKPPAEPGRGRAHEPEDALERSYTDALSMLDGEDSGPASASASMPQQPKAPDHALARSYTDALSVLSDPYGDDDDDDDDDHHHRHDHSHPGERSFDSLDSLMDERPASASGSQPAMQRPQRPERPVRERPLRQPKVPRGSTEWTHNPRPQKKVKNQAPAARGPAPGFTGANLPPQINPVRMGIGVMIAAAGLLFLLMYLPRFAPRTVERPVSTDDAGQVTETEKVQIGLTPSLYLRGQIGAGGLVFAGLLFMVNAAFFKEEEEIVCKRCKRYVIARRDNIFMKCPRSSHTARLCVKTLGLVAILIVFATLTAFVFAISNVGPPPQ